MGEQVGPHVLEERLEDWAKKVTLGESGVTEAIEEDMLALMDELSPDDN